VRKADAVKRPIVAVEGWNVVEEANGTLSRLRAMASREKALAEEGPTAIADTWERNAETGSAADVGSLPASARSLGSGAPIA
jgi:hypothetical protein